MKIVVLVSLGFATLSMVGCPKSTTPENSGAAPVSGTEPAAGTTAEPDVGPEGETPSARLERQVATAVEGINKGDVESLRASMNTLQTLATEHPDVAEIQYDIGVAARGLGDTATAQKSFLRATDIDPTLGNAWLNLGALAEQDGDLNRALQNYQTGLSHDPKNNDLIVGVIGVLRKQGRRDEAITQAKAALVKNANNINAYNNLGLVYVDQGNYDLALFVYLKALNNITGADSNALLHCNLGKVYLLRNETVLARKELERSLELDPKLVASLMFLANDRLDNHDYAGAAEMLEKAKVLEPDNPAISMNLGIAYRGLGRYDEAKAAYAATLALQPANPDPYLNLAVLLGAHENAYDEALANIQKYRDAGGRDLATADAWQKDIETQKTKYEASKEREAKRKEREAKQAEQKRIQEEKIRAEEEQKAREAAQAPPTPEVPVAPSPDPNAPAPETPPAPVPDPSAPAPAPAPDPNAPAPTPDPNSPWGG